VLALVLADLVDRHDVGVIQVARRLGLLAKPLDGLVIKLVRQDHLEGHRPVEADLPAAVNDAHATLGDLGLQLVVAEVTDAERRPCDRHFGRTAVTAARVTKPRLEHAFRAEALGSFRRKRGATGRAGARGGHGWLSAGDKVLPIQTLSRRKLTHEAPIFLARSSQPTFARSRNTMTEGLPTGA
jgi:hypothetical protein